MIKPNFSFFTSQKPGNSQELSRILSAAVVNSHFCSNLLKDPLTAIATGYSGECFSLDNQVCKKLGAIHASSLADFAAQLSAI